MILYIVPCPVCGCMDLRKEEFTKYIYCVKCGYKADENFLKNIPKCLISLNNDKVKN